MEYEYVTFPSSELSLACINVLKAKNCLLVKAINVGIYIHEALLTTGNGQSRKSLTCDWKF